MFNFFFLYFLLLLNEGHSLSKEGKSYIPVEFWDKLLALERSETVLHK